MADVILQMRSMRSVVPPNRYAGRELFCEPEEEEEDLYCTCCDEIYEECPCDHESDNYCSTCDCCEEIEIRCRCRHEWGGYCDSEDDE